MDPYSPMQPQAGWYPSAVPPGPPPKPSAGTAVAAGALALLTGLIYGAYTLTAMFMVLDSGTPQGSLCFGLAFAGCLVVFVGAFLVFFERAVADEVLVVGALLIAIGAVVLSFVPFEGFLRDPDDPRMMFNLIALAPALLIGLLALLPATRRYLSAPRRPKVVAAADPVGKAFAIAGSVCGLLLGLVWLSLLLDLGWEGTILGWFSLFLLTGVVLVVVGALVVFGRKWSGGLLLAVGGGIVLVNVLLGLLSGGGGGIDLRTVVILLASIGSLVFPLLPPTRAHLRVHVS